MRKRTFGYSTAIAGFSLLAGLTVPAAAQTATDLLNDHKTPGDVLTYGMGYNAQRHSPLKRINKSNVKNLVAAWAYSMTDQLGLEAQPLVHDGVIYITNHNRTAAVDGVTGKEIWRHTFEYPPEVLRVVCCGIVNRGAALYQGKLIRGTLDNRVIALDMKTGKEVWATKADVDFNKGYSITAAPLVANGVAVIGVAGAEYGIRGFLDGYDAETGKHLWRRYTIPAKGEKGSETWPANDAIETGGGSTWVTGSYDPELDLVFWGTGNPAPWNPRGRKGDNLYTNSVLAVKPKTGEVAWYSQTDPYDPFDHDGVNALVQADIKVDGEMKKVVMQAHRDGFLYLLERATGKFLKVNKFVTVNWASGWDYKSNRPILTQVALDALEGKKVEVWPSLSGGTNWHPMSYSPIENTLFINAFNLGMNYQAPEAQKVVPGERALHVDLTPVKPAEQGHLKAVDPTTGKEKWSIPFKVANTAGTMNTAGGLVFTGQLTGEFIAVDSSNGKILWKFQTPSGIISQPITWEKDGVQYVTVGSGIGGVYAMRTAAADVASVPTGSTLWTFKLHGK
jgi:alcohol dehydrogenase (cytochrome c)